ncbi:uncharacterized protein LOC102804694 isoform X2 [Saccoglossus kowalevskii]
MDASADASTVEEQSALAQGTDGDAETLEIPVIEGGDHGSDGAAALAMSNDYSLYVQEVQSEINETTLSAPNVTEIMQDVFKSLLNY